MGSQYNSNGITKVPIQVSDGSGSLVILKAGIHSSSLETKDGLQAVIAASASLCIETDPDDESSVQFRVPKERFGGSNDRIAFYLSGSGHVGIGTKDPETAFDVRDNTEDVDAKDRSAKTKILRIARRSQTFEQPVTASIVSSSTVESSLFAGNNIGNFYDNYIYLTPVDFYNDSLTDYSRTPGGKIMDNGGTLQDGGGRLSYFAQKMIPTGYKATHTKVVGASASDTFGTFSSSFDVATVAEVGASTNVNTERDITDIVGGNGTYCIIKVNINASSKIAGGYIKIAKT